MGVPQENLKIERPIWSIWCILINDKKIILGDQKNGNQLKNWKLSCLSDSSVKHNVHIDICGILFSEKCWKTGTLRYDHFLPFFKSLLQWNERSKNLDLAVFQCLCLGHCDHVIHKSVCPALFWFAWGADGGFPYKNFITSHRPTVKKST